MAFSKMEYDDFSKFLADILARIAAGDPDIPLMDFERYEQRVGYQGLLILRERWETAKAQREVRELIRDCTVPLTQAQGMPTLLERNNRLLAAILRKLSE